MDSGTNKDANTYYEKYEDIVGDAAYRMSKQGDTGRIAYLKEFIETFVPKGGRILDVGCGDMHLSTLLPDYDWYGVDINIKQSDHRAHKHDLMQTPYPYADGFFDGVVCSEVLEHLWDLRVVHNEVKRILKPDGTYIISTPNYDFIDYVLTGYRALLFDPKWPHLFEHIRQYNYETHAKFLNDAGFIPMGHVGADSHYSKFFLQARQALFGFIAQFDPNVTNASVDQLLGVMFPTSLHTIMIVSKPLLKETIIKDTILERTSNAAPGDAVSDTSSLLVTAS